MPLPTSRLLSEENVEFLVSLLGTGRNNAMTSDQIQRKLGLPRQRTNESTRELISYAVHVHGKPILSGVQGFWLAESTAEIREAIRSLESREEGIRLRIKALKKAWAGKTGEVVN